MSYFYLQSKSLLLSHQAENISLAAKTQFNGTNFYKTQKYVLIGIGIIEVIIYSLFG